MGIKKKKDNIMRIDMNPKNGVQKDINLYITDEKILYSKAHTHGFFEFMLVLKGKMIQKLNGVNRVLSENDICILRPEAYHSVHTHENSPLILYNFEVDAKYLNELCVSLGFSSVDDILNEVENYTRYTPFDALECMKMITLPANVTNTVRSDVKQSSLKMMIAKLLMTFVLNPSHALTHKKEESIISSMLAILEDKDNFTLSIKDLCEQTFYTQEHITRLFRKANLSSPNRIHMQKKLQYAANLLLNSDLKIIDIAAQCGIDTIAYFTKMFKREYGYSPSSYRKMYRRNI